MLSVSALFSFSMEQDAHSLKQDVSNRASYPKEGQPYILGLALGDTRRFRHFMWGLQITFWLLWFMLAANSVAAQISSVGPVVFSLVHISILMVLVYINYLWLIPHFLVKRKYASYLLLFLGLIALRTVGGYLAHVYVLDEAELFPQRMPMMVGLCFMLLLGSTLFKFIEGWFKVSQRQVQMQNEQLRSELQFLRAQVNPHFLFNTLNNLYSLTLVQDKRAPQMVAQLSELMRYLIYDSSTTRVKLLREMELMASYINLQQLQHDEEKNVDFYFEGVKNHHQIAPLLLISFVENSFKHGDLATNPNAWISISAIVEEHNRLHMSFHNSYRPSHSTRDQEGGIGLKNAQRQLELNYPDRHTLAIEKLDNEFRVDLYIELDVITHAEPPSMSIVSPVPPQT